MKEARKGKVMKPSLASPTAKNSRVFPPPPVSWRDEGITRRRREGRWKPPGAPGGGVGGGGGGRFHSSPVGRLHSNITRRNDGINNRAGDKTRRIKTTSCDRTSGDSDRLSTVSKTEVPELWGLQPSWRSVEGRRPTNK